MSTIASRTPEADKPLSVQALNIRVVQAAHLASMWDSVNDGNFEQAMWFQLLYLAACDQLQALASEMRRNKSQLTQYWNADCIARLGYGVF